LLAISEVESLSMEPNGLVQQFSYAALIGIVPGQQLLPKLTPKFPLPRQQRYPLMFKLPVGGLKPDHLIVCQLQPSANQIPRSLPEALLELPASRYG